MNRKTRGLLEKSFRVPNRKSFQITPLLAAMVLLLSTRALAQEQSMPGMQMPAAQNDMHHHHAAQCMTRTIRDLDRRKKEPGKDFSRWKTRNR